MLAGCMALTACVPPGIACPADGVMYVGPIEIVVEPEAAPVGDIEIAACFGKDCDPAHVGAGSAREWEIPQEPPYLPRQDATIDPSEGIRVVVSAPSGEVHYDGWKEVPAARSQSGFGLCSQRSAGYDSVHIP